MLPWNSVWRAGLLFAAGHLQCHIHRLLLLQRQSKLGLNTNSGEGQLDVNDWWVAPAVGALTAMLGLIFPILEQRVGSWKWTSWCNPPVHEWTGVLRCSVLFVGISHASAKVEYPSTFQLAVTLAALCAVLWWCFDRSLSGLGAGLAVAIASAVIAQWYVLRFHRHDPHPPEWQLWIHYVFFSGGITTVILGRHLAALSLGNGSSVCLKKHD